MSKRAEELAEKYADRQLEIVDKELSESNYSRYTKMGVHLFEGSDIEEAYLNGYEQAEKDLALTWEDVHELVVIEDRLIHELSIKDDTLPQSKEFYEEVLHRFNEMRK